MAYPAYIREKARSLRERRMTLDEIAVRLAIPKTTVWSWICDIDIVAPGRALQTPARSAARERAARANANRAAVRRKVAHAQGQSEFEELDLEPGFRDFVCMYLGEGYRRNRNRVALANSSPAIVRLADCWIRRFAVNPVTYGLQYHADQDPEYLIRFWAFGLGADESLITPFRKSNSGRLKGRNWRSKWGVLTVGTNDTQLRSRLQAWMDQVQDSWLDSLADGA